MLHLLSEAGRAFLRAFGAAFIVLVPGILAAPNMSVTLSLSAAALVACLSAGLKAVQLFVPQLSFAGLLPGRLNPYYTWVDDFVRAALSAFITALLGWLAMPNLDFSKSVVVGLITGAIAAGFRAVQGAGTGGDVPAPDQGLTLPHKGV